MLSSSELDRRVTLQLRTVTRDATYKSEVVTWPDIATVAARVLESSTAISAGGPATAAAALYARPMKIRIRWRTGLDKSTTRLVYGGQILRITGMAEIGRREGIEFACEDWAHE